MKVVRKYISNDGLYEFDTEEECYNYELSQDTNKDVEYILNNIIFFNGKTQSWNLFDSIKCKKLEGTNAYDINSLVDYFSRCNYIYIRNKKVFAIAARQKNKNTIAELIYQFGREVGTGTDESDEIYFKTEENEWYSGTSIYNELQARAKDLNDFYLSLSINK